MDTLLSLDERGTSGSIDVGTSHRTKCPVAIRVREMGKKTQVWLTKDQTKKLIDQLQILIGEK